jgi:hypothetical protein
MTDIPYSISSLKKLYALIKKVSFYWFHVAWFFALFMNSKFHIILFHD